MKQARKPSRTPTSARRSAIGGASMLVLVTLAVASSAALLEPILLGVQGASEAAERSAVRLLPQRLARAAVRTARAGEQPKAAISGRAQVGSHETRALALGCGRQASGAARRTLV